MKKAGVVVLTVACLWSGAFAERKKIPNQAFAILQSSNGDVFLHIRNNDCTAEYRAVVNETVLGEGAVEVNVIDKVIPFGDSNLYIRCSGGEMTVDLE